MLDVHPPHHAANTWRDFFIHIATIVVGLLIAVGIEQAVEHIHQHEQLKEARAALDLERRKNILVSQRIALNLRSQQEAYAGTLNSLRILRAHPATPLDHLPAPIVWPLYSPYLVDAAWKTLQSSPITALIPNAELQTDARLYRHVENVTEAEGRLWDYANRANRYTFSTESPNTLSPQQLDEVIAAAEDLLSENWKAAVALQNLCDGEKDGGFTSCITSAELSEWKRSPTGDQIAEVYGAAGRDYVARRTANAEQMKKISDQEKELDKEQP